MIGFPNESRCINRTPIPNLNLVMVSVSQYLNNHYYSVRISNYMAIVCWTLLANVVCSNCKLSLAIPQDSKSANASSSCTGKHIEELYASIAGPCRAPVVAGAFQNHVQSHRRLLERMAPYARTAAQGENNVDSMHAQCISDQTSMLTVQSAPIFGGSRTKQSQEL